MPNGYPADVVFPFAYFVMPLACCPFIFGPFLKFRMGRSYRRRFLGFPSPLCFLFLPLW